MAYLPELEFTPLDTSGENYFQWAVDAELYLIANNLGETIKQENTASSQDRARAIIFLFRHIHKDFKMQYLMVNNPSELWTKLKERFECWKQIMLPKARYEWFCLLFQDFKTVNEYHSALLRITSQLKLCGEIISDEEMVNKTLHTFHSSNALLQRQYRIRGFKKYSELLSCLLVDEQNNEDLMKNNQPHPNNTMFDSINKRKSFSNKKHKGG